MGAINATLVRTLVVNFATEAWRSIESDQFVQPKGLRIGVVLSRGEPRPRQLQQSRPCSHDRYSHQQALPGIPGLSSMWDGLNWMLCALLRD